MQYQTKIRIQDTKTFFTCLDVVVVELAEELKRRKIEYKVYSNSEIPDGAPQYVKRNGEIYWDDVCCFETHTNIDDLQALADEIEGSILPEE